MDELPKPPRLLDRVREAIRVRQNSIRTEEAYVHWTRRFILFHHKKHPAAMGADEVNAFLTHLAVQTTMIYTHVLNSVGGRGVRSPLETL